MNAPKIEPIKVTEYESKQSKYNHCGRLLIRSIVLGPSGSGKTVLLTNLILDVYKCCFSRIYIFSPSINVDTTRQTEYFSTYWPRLNNKNMPR